MLTRRNFMKLAGAVSAGMFLNLYNSDIVKAIENAGKTGIKLVWIQGQSDTGCTISLLQGEHPDIYDAIMKLNVDIRFHPTIMAAQGEEAMAALDIEPDVLVVEGSIPDPEFATMGERPIRDIVRELAAKTKVAVVAVGACATYGGIPAAEGNVTNSTGVQYLKAKKGGALGAGFLSGAGLPVVNLPGCPAHPDHVLLTLSSVILGVIPELDDKGRPVMFFSSKIHDECARRGFYDVGAFAESFHETDFSHEKCLYQLGCRGPVTLSDCSLRKWNGGINVCMNSGAPCIGCFHESFPDAMSPLFEPIEKVPTLLGINPVTAGKAAVAATAAGIAIHAARRGVAKKTADEGGEEK
ncbi:MAG: hydrogenase small subunit [Candidatus Methanoperedens sp.]|nr:hydrogenase small subunit [Candidatus Methanoperedens sp.]PKL52922.1 MAG: [NiFe] hydrogenase small subunit HydA [Candidatus Methanoperedenaceae archaeon HGW-Methanoperedenaceae-1]